MSTRFNTRAAARFYDMVNDGWADDTLGNAPEGFGFYALFADECVILEEDSDGFVSELAYGSPAETRAAWRELEADWEDWAFEAETDMMEIMEYDAYDSDVFVVVEITNGPLY